MLRSNRDNRTCEDMVTKSGYHYQKFDIETQDGYVIRLNRIKNPSSFNVAYFQHGLLDNSFTWIVHGVHDSLGYQAWEAGYDVFLGNFRGIYPRRMAANRDIKDYWNYNIDDLANYDLRAFTETIFQTKMVELKQLYSGENLSEEEIKSKLTITYIGHSLGGMVLPPYIINSNIKKQDHHLTHAILLSPAGLHLNHPF
mmetsp:Transcript_34571/g.33782  ORF Transcript_34571/g.33782 Transcript_34571/m.33782 type:complete len:198 (+) Transcript_34571:848-1441(+)